VGKGDLGARALKAFKVWSIAVIAALLSAYSIALLYEGFISDHYSGFWTYPFVDKPAAERAYDRLPANASGAERTAAAQRLVMGDPANPESWAAVAYADYVTNGRLTPKGVLALDHSYAVSFFDRRGAVWRINFALENWVALSPDLRKQVLTEAGVALKDSYLRPELKPRLLKIRSPEGRLAALLLLAQYPDGSER
jgi:hypothetical protein